MANNKTPVSVPIKAKQIHYQSDGTGRDFYISRLNGGFLSKQALQEVEPKGRSDYEKMHFLTKSSNNLNRNTSQTLPPKIPIKTQRYWGDGTGRDNFVIINDGGMCTPYRWQDNFELAYKRSLRTYTKSNWPSQPLSTQLSRVQSAAFFEQVGRCNKLADPKPVLQPKKRPFTPNIRKAHKIYQSWQTLEYQTKARNQI